MAEGQNSLVGKQVPCKLCGSTTSLNIDTIHHLDNIPVHYFCLLFSSGLGQRGSEAEGIKGFLAIDVKREIKRGSRLKCTYCRKKGATVGCAEPRCKKTYHLQCGSAHHSLQQYYDQFKSFCKEHRPTQKTRKPNCEEKSVSCDHNQCGICRERIIRKATAKTLWSPCCGAFQHRNCVQGLAVTQGRERFRCPVCKDNAEFQDEMRFYGIYVPEQEASREASVKHNEMEQTPSRLCHIEMERTPARLCHAKLCFCDKFDGRSLHSENGIWKILLCEVCGSRGIHAKCGGLEDSVNPVWNCYTCRAVLRERGEEPVTIPASDDRWKSPGSVTIPTSDDQRKSPGTRALNSHHSPLQSSHDTPSEKSSCSSFYDDQGNSRTEKSDNPCNIPSERSRDASNSMFRALLASLPAVESSESSQASLPSPPQAKASPRKEVEYKVTITPVIKSQKRRILSSKGPTVSSRPLWPSRKSTGSVRSATIARPVGSPRSFINAQTGSLINVSNGIQTGLGADNISNVASTMAKSTVVSSSTAASQLQHSSATVLSVPRVSTHSKPSQSHQQAVYSQQDPGLGPTGATSGINLSVPVKRKNRVEIQKVDLTDNKFMVQNKQLETSTRKERSDINCQKITSRTSLTDLITPILDARPSHASNHHTPPQSRQTSHSHSLSTSSNGGTLSTSGGTLSTNGGTLSTNGGTPRTNGRTLSTNTGTLSTSGGTLRTSGGTFGASGGTLSTHGGTLSTSGGTLSTNGVTLSTSGGTLRSNGGTLSSNVGTLSASGGTSFADLVTPILNSNNHLQVNLKKDHFAVSDEHEVSPGDSDYESSYEMKGAAMREGLEAVVDATKVSMEKRNNIVTITKHKKIVLSKNEYDRNGGQLRVTDFYPNKRN